MNRLLFILLLLIFKSGFSGENPYIRHYGISEGLLTNTVYHVSQDREGFLWFSTDAGVVKYNGTIFQNFRKRDGLTDKDILRTQEDSQGRVWIFSFNGNIHFHYKNKIYNQLNTDFLGEIDSKGFILGFYEDQDSTLYFYTSHGLIYGLKSDNTVQKWDYPSLSRLYFITSGSDNKILYVTQTGLFIADNFSTTPVLYRSMDNLNAFPAGDSNYLILTRTNELLDFIQEKQQASDKNPVGTHMIITSFTDHSGLRWFSTLDKGVFCLKENKILFNLPVSQAQLILEDAGNNIWITSMKEGIYKIHPGFTTIRHYPAEMFDGKAITALHPDEQGEVWLANGKSVYKYCLGKFHKAYAGQETFYIDILTEIGNQLLFGQRNDAMFALKLDQKDNVASKTTEPTLFNSYLKGYSLNKSGTEICIQHINHLYIYKSNDLLNPGVFKLNERIYFTGYDRHQGLVVNLNDRILYLQNDTLIPSDELRTFYGKRIDDLLVIDPGHEVLNIEGDSLWLVTDKKTRNLMRDLSYPIRHPIKKLLYHDPFLYLTTTDKIYRMMIPNGENAETKLDLQLLDIRFNTIHDVIFQNDTLFIATDDGLTLISPEEFNQSRNIFLLPYFTNVQAKEKKLDFEGKKKIELRGNTDLHIDFDVINYSESQVLYSYKLEGLEASWNTGPETSVVYKNLSSETYTFQLRAKSFGSAWSEPIQLVVLVKPAIYQRKFFIGAVIILLLLIIYFVSRYYFNRLKKGQELKTKLITYEQKALQSMMNPHFIFNSLGSIQNYLLQNKANEASLYLSQFARLIRQNLNSANSAFISIEDETDRLMNYLSLEKLRLDDKFDFHIKVDPELHTDEVLIPSMVIQPFVENAVWHGISPINEKGRISILINRESEKSLLITVEDNGIGMKQSGQYFTKHDHISIGMETTQKRLNLICRQHKLKFEIQFSEVLPGQPSPGTMVRFNIPYKDNPDLT